MTFLHFVVQIYNVSGAKLLETLGDMLSASYIVLSARSMTVSYTAPTETT